jgi:hypothetical protein
MKSQGLPINFLVKFILAFVIFILGVTLLWTIFDQGKEMTIDPSQHIRALNCRPTEPICVGATSVNLGIRESVAIDVRVFNNRDEPVNYTVTVTRYNESGDPISDSNILDLRPGENLPPIQVPARGSADFSVLVLAGRNAPKGAYSVRILLESQDSLSNLRRRVNVFVR